MFARSGISPGGARFPGFVSTCAMTAARQERRGHRSRDSRRPRRSWTQELLCLALLPIVPISSLPSYTSVHPQTIVCNMHEKNVIVDEDFKPPCELEDGKTLQHDETLAHAEKSELRRPRNLANRLVPFGESHLLFRSAVAIFCGFVIGFERRSAHSLAGVRVCSLVSLGTSILFSIALASSKNSEGLGRAVASAATSVGFLGTNVFALNSGRDFRRGLTTSCGIWLSAACGIGPYLDFFNSQH